MKSNILQNRLNKIAVLSKTGDVTQEVIQRLISEEQTQQQKIKERAQTDINPIQLLNDTLSQYSRQTEQVKMPWWLPPTIKEAIEPFTVMGGGIAFSCLLCEQLYIKIFCHFQCG
ncbi:Conserved_hypothetical protein [Hexamita inflata]|uniref:Uncharacterized protein n=1 Tax=Hexamita inflata TaxID=28002 RepID=A0ABP1GXM1_9EUKA